MTRRVPPFYIWAPIPVGRPELLKGVRHAFPGTSEDYGEGDRVVSLCGQAMTYTKHGCWLRYPTCMDCWGAAKILIERATDRSSAERRSW